jgi:hypothetical protein
MVKFEKIENNSEGTVKSIYVLDVPHRFKILLRQMKITKTYELSLTGSGVYSTFCHHWFSAETDELAQAKALDIIRQRLCDLRNSREECIRKLQKEQAALNEDLVTLGY